MIKNRNYFKKAFVFFFIIIISNEFFLQSRAKIKTKIEADNFLNEYCIVIVNAIKEAYETQIISIKNNELEKFREQGLWIGGLSDVYSKLCIK